MKYLKQMLCVGICGVMLAAATGCSGSLTGGKRIIRISHAQSETHPEHLGLLKFKEYVEANLGNKYAMFEAIHGTAPFLIDHNRGD